MFPGMMPGMPPLDPSKMDPKTIAAMTDLIRTLPPDRILKIQTLMHNAMAGFDVKKEMEDFEKSLPPGFREKMAAIMAPELYKACADAPPSSPSQPTEKLETVDPNMDVNAARITVLRGVSEGRITPEEALKLLF